MSAGPVDVTSIDALLLDVFPENDKVWLQINFGTKLLDLVEKTYKVPFLGKKEGRQIIIPVWTGGNPNEAVSSPEGVGYATPGNQDTNRVSFNICKLVSALTLNDHVIETAGGGGQSLVDAMVFQMKGILMNHRRKKNWLLHRDGSGEVGRLRATGTGTILGLADSIRFVDGTDMSMVRPGMEISLLDRAVGTSLGGFTLGAPLVVRDGTVDTTNNTCRLDDENGVAAVLAATADVPAGLAFGAYFFTDGTAADTQGEHPNGIGIMTSDQNPDNWGGGVPPPLYGDTDRTVETWWQGYALDAAGELLNVQDHLDDVLDEIDSRAPASYGEPELLAVCRYQNYNAIKHQLERDQRTDGREVNLRYKHKGLQYQNAIFVKDRDAVRNEVRFFDYRHTRNYLMKKPFWENKGGAIWRQQNTATGRPTGQWRANLIEWTQWLSCENRSSAVIRNTNATR